VSDEFKTRVEALELAVLAVAREELGDLPGHRFRGNQHTNSAAIANQVSYGKGPRDVVVDRPVNADRASGGPKGEGRFVRSTEAVPARGEAGPKGEGRFVRSSKADPFNDTNSGPKSGEYLLKGDGGYSPHMEADALELGTHKSGLRVHSMNRDGTLPYYSKVDIKTLTHKAGMKATAIVVGEKVAVQKWAELNGISDSVQKTNPLELKVGSLSGPPRFREPNTALEQARDRAIRTTGADPSWYGR
jgi:hypothetical protein